MSNEDIVYDLKDLNIPKEYYSISAPKLEIVREIKKALDRKNMTIRTLAEKVGTKHPQIVRVTSGENYNIETLLKILDVLDLQITVGEKKESMH